MSALRFVPKDISVCIFPPHLPRGNTENWGGKNPLRGPTLLGWYGTPNSAHGWVASLFLVEERASPS